MDSNTITKIVDILTEDSTVVAEWLQLYYRLGLDMDIETIKKRRNNGTLNSKDLFRNIMENWVSENASVEMLCQALEQMKRFNASENIQAALNINTANSTDPILFGFERMSTNFTGRSHHVDEIEKMLTNTARDDFVKIIGMGGIGKTELAKKFANQLKQWNCIWLNAENAPNLLASVTKLGKTLGITDGSIKFIDLFQSCLETIKKKNSFKVLVIVDNVDADYYEALAVISVIKDQQNCFAIVTSRNVGVMGWAGDATINLRTLADDEAIKLVRSSLEGESDQDISSLCQQLDNFPLALQQAVAFIKQKQLKGVLQKGFKIRQYLQHYEIEKKILLNHPLVKLEHEYSKTTLIIWQTSIDAIKAEGKVGKISIDLLNIIAFMEPDNIPLYFIKDIYNIFEGSTVLVDESIELLIAYSLITVQYEMIFVYRLVQEVARSKMTTADNKTLIKLKSAIEKVGELSEFNVREQTHILSVWKYSIQNIQKHSEVSFDILGIIAYMETDSIPVKFIEEIYDKIEWSADQVIEAIKLLTAYSFVKVKMALISVSLEVQNLVRVHFGDDRVLIKLTSVIDKVSESSLFGVREQRHIWCIRRFSIDAIKAEGDVGKISIEILKIIAYMENDNIAVKFIKEINDKFERSTNQVIEAIKLLTTHSFVKVKMALISVHLAVQDFLRVNLADNTILIKLIRAIDEFDESSVFRVPQRNHVLSVWRYFSQLQDIKLQREFMPKRVKLINQYFLYHDIEDTFFRDSVKIARQVLRKDDNETLILASRAATYQPSSSVSSYDPQNVENLKAVLIKQTEIQEERESVITTYSLCFTLVKLGKIHEALEVLQTLRHRDFQWNQLLFNVVDRLSYSLQLSKNFGDALELDKHVLTSIINQKGDHHPWAVSIMGRIRLNQTLHNK